MLRCNNCFNPGTRTASIIYIALSPHLAKIRIAEAAFVFFAYKSGRCLFSVFVFHNLLSELFLNEEL
jgi:hypothetical protein